VQGRRALVVLHRRYSADRISLLDPHPRQPPFSTPAVQDDPCLADPHVDRIVAGEGVSGDHAHRPPPEGLTHGHVAAWRRQGQRNSVARVILERDLRHVGQRGPGELPLEVDGDALLGPRAGRGHEASQPQDGPVRKHRLDPRDVEGILVAGRDAEGDNGEGRRGEVQAAVTIRGPARDAPILPWEPHPLPVRVCFEGHGRHAPLGAVRVP